LLFSLILKLWQEDQVAGEAVEVPVVEEVTAEALDLLQQEQQQESQDQAEAPSMDIELPQSSPMDMALVCTIQ